MQRSGGLAVPLSSAPPAPVQPLDEEMNEHKKLQVEDTWDNSMCCRLAC